MTDEARHEAEAALRPVGGVSGVQVVGGLETRVIDLLGLTTTARSVWLHESVVEHIRLQRGIKKGDAEFALQHMAGAIIRPMFCGHDPNGSRRDPYRKALVQWVEPAQRFLCVAIKFVDAARANSYTDELWVSTAYPLPENFLRQQRWLTSLTLVKWGADD